MEIASVSFREGGKIPRKHTCDGDDTSPPLTISGLPDGAASIAIIMDDPDAPMGTFVHWVVWNIEAGNADIAAGTGVGGTNSFRRTGYNGPCPPPGKPHRYYFKAYALDSMLSLKPGSGKAALEAAMEGHILGSAELMGTYSR